MATRSSGHFNGEMYRGTRRGRPDMMDMDWSMFPEKTESTRMVEDPNALDQHNRDLLKDFSPENSRLFAYEEPRRNTYAKDRLNIRDGGARVTTDPWQNEDYDTQFHDKDPRGWSVEQPWSEYRRLLEAQLRMTDFKDDGDYSTTGGGVHPNTLYSTIRAAQDWVRARLKIFSTSYNNQHAGGVGVYPNVSKVFKSEYEDSSVMTDGTRMSQTFEDPVIRQRTTSLLSNIVHGGSKALRANSTTDHRVKVASYGKLLRQRGLINHENQLRLVGDDTHWSIVEGQTGGAPRSLTAIMSAAVDGQTAAEIDRLSRQAAGMAPAETERFSGGKYNEKSQEARSNTLTGDIIALLGVTENDLKLLESQSTANKQYAKQALANLYEMVEMVHRAPAHIKLQIRDELLLQAAGGGLRSAGDGIHRNRDSVVLNPKIVAFMDSVVRTSQSPSDLSLVRDAADGDPEHKLNHILAGVPIWVPKSTARDSEDITLSLTNTNPTHKPGETLKTHSYKSLAIEDSAENRNESVIQALLGLSHTYELGKNRPQADDLYNNTIDTEIDNQFGDNEYIARHTGLLGDKRTGLNQDNEFTVRDTSEVITSHSVRKNPITKHHKSYL